MILYHEDKGSAQSNCLLFKYNSYFTEKFQIWGFFWQQSQHLQKIHQLICFLKFRDKTLKEGVFLLKLPLGKKVKSFYTTYYILQVSGTKTFTGSEI